MKQHYPKRLLERFAHPFVYASTLLLLCVTSVSAQSVVITNFNTGALNFTRTPTTGTTLTVVKDVNDTTNRVLSFNWTNLTKLTNCTLLTGSNGTTFTSTNSLVREVLSSVPNAVLKVKVFVPANVLIDSLQLSLRNNTNTAFTKSQLLVLGATYTPGWQTLTLDAPIPAGTIIRDIVLNVWGVNGTGNIYVDDILAETTTPSDSITLWNFNTVGSTANNFQRWNTTDNGSHPPLNYAVKDQEDTTNRVLELNWTTNNFAAPKNIAIYTGSTANLSNNVILREVLGSINYPVKIKARIFVPATSIVAGFRLTYSLGGGKNLISDSIQVVPNVAQWYTVELPAFVPSQYPSPKELLFWAYGIEGAGLVYIDDIVAVKDALAPLQLQQFTVAANANNQAHIAWQTTNEVNTAYFGIEQSIDGKSFQNIATVLSKNAAFNDYAYVANVPLKEGVQYFRLKMVDADGTFSYSAVKAVTVLATNRLRVYPNPANNRVVINHASIKQSAASLRIVNQLGLVVATYAVQNAATSTTVSVSYLAAGSYRVELVQGNRTVTATQLLIQK